MASLAGKMTNISGRDIQPKRMTSIDILGGGNINVFNKKSTESSQMPGKTKTILRWIKLLTVQ
jgi:hypothetical protein